MSRETRYELYNTRYEYASYPIDQDPEAYRAKDVEIQAEQGLLLPRSQSGCNRADGASAETAKIVRRQEISDNG